MDLKNKKVVITGASSGIGLAVLRRLLEEGAVVVAAARHTQNINIKTDNLILCSCDVSVREEVDRLFSFAVSALGTIDIFIANAGFAYYEIIDTPDWVHAQSIFDTNVLSVIYSAEKMKALRADQPYTFLCTASAMSFLSIPGYALYSGTKAALRGFADAYRHELKPGQNFLVAFPIATRTQFFSRAGGSPVTWPAQEADIVARAMLRAIRRNRKNIFPSRTFRFISLVNRVFPFILSLYAQNEKRKMLRHFSSERSL